MARTASTVRLESLREMFRKGFGRWPPWRRPGPCNRREARRARGAIVEILIAAATSDADVTRPGALLAGDLMSLESIAAKVGHRAARARSPSSLACASCAADGGGRLVLPSQVP